MSRLLRSTEWFETWFDSPYCQLLYRHRDGQEAFSFLKNFRLREEMQEGDLVLDLGCGNGRHSTVLHNMGFRVWGLDLSVVNIGQAKDFEKAGLNFYVADMRSFSLGVRFDFIFNMFTSFGYFKEDSDNEKVLKNCLAHLKPSGKLIIDYFNPLPVLRELPSLEAKTINNVKFNIKRFADDKSIIKEIDVQDAEAHYKFTEKVMILNRSKFATLAEETGFKICRTYGDYTFSRYDPENSDRLILILQPA